MSEEADALASRIREQIGLWPGIVEKRMMGGVAFMLEGNMLVGPLKDGGLLVRVGKEGYAEALALPGAAPMTFTGRAMSGFVQVYDDGIDTAEALAAWIARAEKFVRTLPKK